jgi:hypothetical protein
VEVEHWPKVVIEFVETKSVLRQQTFPATQIKDATTE